MMTTVAPITRVLPSHNFLLARCDDKKVLHPPDDDEEDREWRERLRLVGDPAMPPGTPSRVALSPLPVEQLHTRPGGTLIFDSQQEFWQAVPSPRRRHHPLPPSREELRRLINLVERVDSSRPLSRASAARAAGNEGTRRRSRPESRETARSEPGHSVVSIAGADYLADVELHQRVVQLDVCMRETARALRNDSRPKFQRLLQRLWFFYKQTYERLLEQLREENAQLREANETRSGFVEVVGKGGMLVGVSHPESSGGHDVSIGEAGSIAANESAATQSRANSMAKLRARAKGSVRRLAGLGKMRKLGEDAAKIRVEAEAKAEAEALAAQAKAAEVTSELRLSPPTLTANWFGGEESHATTSAADTGWRDLHASGVDVMLHDLLTELSSLAIWTLKRGSGRVAKEQADAAAKAASIRDRLKDPNLSEEERTALQRELDEVEGKIARLAALSPTSSVSSLDQRSSSASPAKMNDLRAAELRERLADPNLSEEERIALRAQLSHIKPSGDPDNGRSKRRGPSSHTRQSLDRLDLTPEQRRAVEKLISDELALLHAQIVALEAKIAGDGSSEAEIAAMQKNVDALNDRAAALRARLNDPTLSDEERALIQAELDDIESKAAAIKAKLVAAEHSRTGAARSSFDLAAAEEADAEAAALDARAAALRAKLSDPNLSAEERARIQAELNGIEAEAAAARSRARKLRSGNAGVEEIGTQLSIAELEEALGLEPGSLYNAAAGGSRTTEEVTKEASTERKPAKSDDDLEAEIRRRFVKKVPWAKYMKRRPKKIKARNVTISQMLQMIGEVYEAKLCNDRIEDREGMRRTPITTSVNHYFYKKYGLKNMAEEYIYALVGAINQLKDGSKRVKVFGTLCGIVDPEYYSPHLADMALEVVGNCFPAKSVASKLGNDNCCVDLLTAKNAILKIFPKPDTGQRMRRYTEVGRMGSANGAAKLGKDQQARTDRFLKGLELPPKPTRTYGTSAALRKGLLERVDGEIAKTLGELEKRSGRAKSGKENARRVVLLDDLLELVLEMFKKRLDAQRTRLQDIFVAFDTDHNGVLDLNEFKSLISTLTGEEAFTEKFVFNLFDEMYEISGAGLGENGEDAVSQYAFGLVCLQHGIEPPSSDVVRTHSTQDIMTAIPES